MDIFQLVSEGQVHNCLGMMLHYTTPEMLKVDMIDYIGGVLAEVPGDMKGTAVTPAASYLFKVNKIDDISLGVQQWEVFHHITMQLAYLVQWVCPNIHTTIAFLQVDVTNPDEDDYKKLAQVVKYLHSTDDMVLTLKLSDDGILTWGWMHHMQCTMT